MPEDIEKALRNSFSGDKSQQDLQHLALAHIDTEKALQAQVRSGTSPYSAEFIAGCHKLFCDRLPESMLALLDGDVMIPGAFRTTEVFVRDHVAPAHGSVAKFMRRFEEAYNAPRSPRSAQLIAIAAAHHRLVWIHPFADGNGRVSRLVTGAMLKVANINDDGLWSLPRDLAKSSKADASDPANRYMLDSRLRRSVTGSPTCIPRARSIPRRLRRASSAKARGLAASSPAKLRKAVENHP